MTLRLPGKLRNLGDATTGASCSNSDGTPSFGDYLIGPSTSCCNWLQINDPNNLLYQWDCPQAPGIASQIGTTVGSAAGAAVGAAASSAASASAPSSLLIYGGVAVVFVMVLMMAKK